MPNGPNSGNRLLYGIVTGLTILFAAGGITLAVAYGQLETRTETVERTQAANASVIRDAPVIANEIQHIKESIEEIEETQDEILKAIKALEKS